MKQSKKSSAKVPPKSEIRRIIEYFVSGGVWFWSGYILIVTLDGPLGELWGEGAGLFAANLIGNGVGITLNFLLQRYWVFKTQDATKLVTATTRYVIYTILNAFLLNFLILLGLKRIGIEPEFGQFIAAGFFTVWNYIWYKVYVFKEVQTPKKSART